MVRNLSYIKKNEIFNTNKIFYKFKKIFSKKIKFNKSDALLEHNNNTLKRLINIFY